MNARTIWQTAAAGLAAMCMGLGAQGVDFFGTPATPAPAPAAPAATTSGGPWLYRQWTEDVTVPAGSYRGGEKQIDITAKRHVTISRGCLIEKAHLNADRDAMMTIDASLFRETTLSGDVDVKVTARDSAFDGCTMHKSGGLVHHLWSTRWSFENCVFAGKLMSDGLATRHYSVRADRCTVHNAGLPGVGYREDPSDEAQGNDFRFANCKFVVCDVPESFLAATVDCVFEDCHFAVKREDWTKATKAISVTAYIVSKATPPVSYINGQLKVTFKTATPPVAGASLVYTNTGGHLSYAAVSPAGQPVTLGRLDGASNPAAVAKAGTPAPASNARAADASIPIAAVPSAPTPVGAGTAELLKLHRNNLVFVSGADGSGSGFVANLGGANFLVTNAHVAAGIKSAGFKSLDGNKVPVGAPSVAVGHDIFRMALPAGGKPMEVMQGVDENAAIGDEVVVLGNAEGAGVINTIKGRIVGLGPNLVEVDAAFQPGNSGSPIIHLNSGKVIGVATYLTFRRYDPATKEPVKTPVVRRFGYRLDSVKAWQPVAWPQFYAQAGEMAAIEKLTVDLGEFLRDLGMHKGHLTQGAHTNPAIKSRIDQWLEAKSRRISAKDAATVDQNFISFLKVTCQSDLTAARPRMTYDYFQRGLSDQQQERTQIAEVFDTLIKEIQKGR